MEIRLLKYDKLPEPCDCLCHRGKCNHTATPCHTIFRVREEWELELPGGEKKQLLREWVYDDRKRTVKPSLLDAVSEILQSAGFVFFVHQTWDDWDSYYYFQRCHRVVSPIRNCTKIGVDGISVTGPWFGHTESAKTSNTIVVVLDPQQEAEWEVYEYGKTNTPHSFPILCKDEESGEDYVMLKQCWGRREWEYRERYIYRPNQGVERVTLYSRSTCDGECNEE